MGGLRRLVAVLLWLAAIAWAWSRRQALIDAGRQLGEVVFGSTPAVGPTSGRFGGSVSAPPTAADETLAVQRELAERAPAGAGRPGAGADVDVEADAGAVGAGGTPAGAVPGDGTRECPDDHPIKGNASSMIYHAPGQASYANTIAEFCFASAEAAEAAGYRPPRR